MNNRLIGLGTNTKACLDLLKGKQVKILHGPAAVLVRCCIYATEIIGKVYSIYEPESEDLPVPDT